MRMTRSSWPTALLGPTASTSGDTAEFIPYVEEDFGVQDSPSTDAEPRRAPTSRCASSAIVRTPMEPLFVSDGLVLASPGLHRSATPTSASHENAVVQLRDPTEGHGRRSRRTSNTDVAPGTPVLDLHDGPAA